MEQLLSDGLRHKSGELLRPALIWVGALLLLAAACGQKAPGPETPSPTSEALTLTPSPAVEPTPTPAVATRTPRPTVTPATITPEPPERDLFDIARRVGLTGGDTIPRTVSADPVAYREGHQATFWVVDMVNASAYRIRATLEIVSEHAYWYVDDSLELSRDDLRAAATAFETEIHSAVTGAFGDIWNPGVDNDPRLTVLHTPIRAAEGYYGSQDEYPRQIHPQSNQREMIYMDGSRLRPGSAVYLGVLAHELQHAVHWNLDSGEEAWVNEGMSEVASELTGHRSLLTGAFLRKSDVQLNYWPDELGASAAHYGASKLFFSYLAQHYGGIERLRELAREPADGIEGVEVYLRPYGKTFRDVFEDWVVANYVDASEGPYGYPDRRVSVRDVDVRIDFGETRHTAPQFAARYVDLRLEQGDALIEFRGEPEVAQVATRCRSGSRCWWSNRGDSIDSTLTREFDLSGLIGATLEFWTWYSVEEHWDYAYVEVSTDGGDTWTIQKGRYTSAENPIGNSYGHGWTGNSGGWIQETVDLSRYAGETILVRFEYITDGAVYLDGLVIDDVAVPELDFLDDGERDLGWHAEGFVRSDLILPQEYAVQVVEWEVDGTVSVRDMSLDRDRMGHLVVQGFGSRIEHAVIVVSPVTAGTHQPASYSLDIGAAPG